MSQNYKEDIFMLSDWK